MKNPDTRYKIRPRPMLPNLRELVDTTVPDSGPCVVARWHPAEGWFPSNGTTKTQLRKILASLEQS